MKTVIEKVETTFFQCDKCDYKNKNEEKVNKHYAEEHACLHIFERGDDKFCYFENEIDANLYVDYVKGYDEDNYMNWEKEGWYYVETSSGYDDYYFAKTYFQNKIDKLQKELSKYTNIKACLTMSDKKDAMDELENYYKNKE